MKWRMHWSWMITAALMVMAGTAAAQISRKILTEKHQRYYDSLKNMKYDRVFPIYGDKVYKRGFDIPFPFGIMINTFYADQEMEISNIRIGVKTPDTTLGPADLSNVIVFDKVQAKAYNINARFDMWLFPFLNVNAMVGYLPKASTAVSLSKPVQISTNPEQSGFMYGIGLMGAGGVGPVWLQADYNLTWADMELLDNKVFTQVAGLRMGHVFPLKHDAEKNISLWIGTMGIFLNSETLGEVKLDDLFPGIPQSKIDEIKQSYSNWYNGLKPPEQKVIDKIMEKLQEKVNGIDVSGTSIVYELDKKAKSPWAGLIGMQYQISKKWQLRSECQFIGSRFSLLASINYRWLGMKKKGF